MTDIKINPKSANGQVSRHIYGHFSEHLGRCIYDGIWVGEDSSIPNTNGIRNDIVEALKKVGIPNLRWPGGCFADEYHWRDGIGTKEERPCMVNTHWGNVTENNHFGTHEFLDLCEMLECEPYICGNLGSGTVQEMSQWVEYLNSDNVSPMTALRKANGRNQSWGVKFFGVGNENWGCGGLMRPEFYADQYRRYACYCRNHGDNKLYRIACGANGHDYHWTETLMSQAARWMDGLSLHYYTSIGKKNPATGFPAREWFNIIRKTLKMDELLDKHSTIMDKYDPDRRVALVVDEWGTWHGVEPGTHPKFLYQQNSLRDALVAAINLNIFNRHCRRVRIANLAQTVNVLQSLILTEGEKMLLTPTWHVFEMYKGHHDGELLDCFFNSPEYEFEGEKIPAFSASATRNKEGGVHLTISNCDHAKPYPLRIDLGQNDSFSEANGRVLTADSVDAHNTFESTETVTPAPLTGIIMENGLIQCELPARSVVEIKIKQ